MYKICHLRKLYFHQNVYNSTESSEQVNNSSYQKVKRNLAS